MRHIRNLSKKAPSRDERVDVNSVICDVIEMTRKEATENGVTIRTDPPQGLAFVQGSRVELQQVLLNLIMNAIEAMSEMNNGTREMRISVTRTEAAEVLVSVRDTGPALAPETLRRLFRAFHTTKPDGLGLGLSICRSISQAHGGRLWANADGRCGAVFQFSLPAHAECIE